MSDEFTVSGLTIPRIAIYEGAILVLWGVAAYIISGQSSITAMIPSFMGAPLMILGLLSEKMPGYASSPHARINGDGTIDGAWGGESFADFSDMSNLAISSHIILIFVGATFMICGIMSFRAARLAREAE